MSKMSFNHFVEMKEIDSDFRPSTRVFLPMDFRTITSSKTTSGRLPMKLTKPDLI
jgi:hypothetical protein